MITDEQLVWVGISECPGIGPITFDVLMMALKAVDLTALDFWELSDKEILSLSLNEEIKRAFILHRKNFLLSKLKANLIQKQIFLVTKKDDLYPLLLKQAKDAPSVLFAKGNLKKSFGLPIGVVGTRQVTGYGVMVTKKITHELVEHGAEIISGFMYGVDAVAHQAALEVGGYTVGVLGYGFDYCYPPEHHRLRKKLIESGGALVSEYLPSLPPIPGFFPQRNRIVAGMSKGVVVTEAAQQSGSKITAQKAVDYGRDVFAVPGMITSKYSQGTKDLVNLGAKLVSSGHEIFYDYFPQKKQKSGKVDTQAMLARADNETEKMILELLLEQSLDSDEIAVAMELETKDILSALALMEMKGLIDQKNAIYFVCL